jgi:hypothetical protein
MKRNATYITWATLLALFCSISVLAQTVTGSIRGTVTDPSGAIIAGAKVVATNAATGVSTTATTNSSGEYSIRFLQIGHTK